MAAVRVQPLPLNCINARGLIQENAAMYTQTTDSSNTTTTSIPAGAYIGHVHLKVADLERSVRFYHDLLGFDIVSRLGDQVAFLSAGGYHHHLGLNTWESKDGQPPPRRTTGLYHFAINYPTRRDLAIALKRLIEGGWRIDGMSDHLTHEALYLHDPDL